MLGVCQQVAAIPMKRAAPAADALPRTRRDGGAAPTPSPRPVASPCETEPCCCSSTTPAPGPRRSPTYESDTSTSARPPSSASTARATNGAPARSGTRPHSCSPSCSTRPTTPPTADTPVFRSATGEALTRFGIYKIVRRHAGHLDDARTDRRVSPHIFRHTAAVHLLEAGVEVNVIRGWLGPRRPHHHQPLRRDQHQERSSRHSATPNRPVLRRDPALVPSGGPTNRCSTGCHRSDRYVAGAGR